MSITSAQLLTKPMNCLIYIRVSSEEQVKNFSLDSQEEICRAFAKSKGYTVIEPVFREEGESASTAERTQLIRLLTYCRQHKDKVTSVIAWKIDRWARDTSDYLAVRKELYKLGIKLESATEPTGESPTDKFIETILVASAQLDNEVKSERTRIGLRKRFEAGLTTRPPLGYKSVEVGTQNVAVPDENFDRVKKAWELMATGTKTLSEMAEIMNEWGLRVRWKKEWKPLTKQSVSKLFKNQFYYGVLVSKRYDEEKKGQHTPMISAEMYYQVQAVVTGRRNIPIGVKHIVRNPNFPLRSIVKCHCGRFLSAGNCRGNGGIYPKYWCPVHATPSISSDKLQKQLEKLLKSIQPTPEAIDLFTLILHTEYNNRLNQLREAKKSAESKVLEAKQMMIALVQGHMKGQYPDDIFEEEKTRLQDQILASQIVVNDSICDKYDIEAITAFIRALLRDLRKAYEASDYGQKRVLLGSIFPSGLYFENGQLLNHDLGALFSLIKEVETYQNFDNVPFSAEDRT